jgi:hypothetical protein
VWYFMLNTLKVNTKRAFAIIIKRLFMSIVSIKVLKERLGSVEQRLSLVDSYDLEIHEMCMLLRANVDDVNSIIELNTHNEESLAKIDQLISNLLVGVNSIHEGDVPST